LSADFARLGEEIKAVETAGADWIHVDVMDGHFVPNITIGAPVVTGIRPITKLPLDVHLMIENPEQYVESFAKSGADYLTFHVEATKSPRDLIQKIRDLGVKPGITLRPPTDVSAIEPFLGLVDLVLIMTVNPGFSGQSFLPDQVEKIRRVRSLLYENSKTLIEVDGGINVETGRLCYEAGARVFVAGNFVFKRAATGGGYAAAIRELKGVQLRVN
jgi:ribulose-phosphate 3-epimerase